MSDFVRIRRPSDSRCASRNARHVLSRVKVRLWHSPGKLVRGSALSRMIGLPVPAPGNGIETLAACDLRTFLSSSGDFAGRLRQIRSISASNVSMATYAAFTPLARAALKSFSTAGAIGTPLMPVQ